MVSGFNLSFFFFNKLIVFKWFVVENLLGENGLDINFIWNYFFKIFNFCVIFKLRIFVKFIVRNF